MTLVRPQQYRIAKLLSDGYSIRQCGETIGIAEKTVSGYLNGLFKRLGVKNSKRDGRAVVIERFRAGDLKPMRPGRGPKPRVGGGALDAPARKEKPRNVTPDDLRWNAIFERKFARPNPPLYVRGGSPLAGFR